MQARRFDIDLVTATLLKMSEGIEKGEDIPFAEFISVLEQFCLLFKQLGTLLGVAFSDVVEKVEIFKANNKRFPNRKGFFDFVQMEMAMKIFKYNGDNNSQLKAPKEFAQYNSTTRNLLRMMWFLTFVRVTFETLRDLPNEGISNILKKAYDCAFGTKHNWFVRKGAQLAIMAAGDKTKLIEATVGKHDLSMLMEINGKFIRALVPVYEKLWSYYKEHDLVDLD